MKESQDLEIKAVRAELDLERKKFANLMGTLENVHEKLTNANDELRKSRKEVQSLFAENKRLLDELSGSKDSPGLAREISRLITQRLGGRRQQLHPQTASSPGTNLVNPSDAEPVE